MLTKAQLTFATVGKQVDGDEPSKEYGRMLIRQIHNRLLIAAHQIDVLRNHPLFKEQVEDLFPIDKAAAELNWAKWENRIQKSHRKKDKVAEATKPQPKTGEVNFDAFVRE